MWKRITATPVTWRQSWRPWEISASAGACYPEGHPESKNKAEDIRYLKEKVDAGCSFLTTQMFFDNDLFYNFLYRIREAGIAVPVVAGIMPVTNAKQMKRILSMSGTVLPTRFKMLLDRFGDDPAAMKQAASPMPYPRSSIWWPTGSMPSISIP